MRNTFELSRSLWIIGRVAQNQPPEVFWDKRPEACNFIKRETLVQRLSYEFCKTFKNTYFEEHLWTTASGCSLGSRVEIEPQRFASFTLTSLVLFPSFIYYFFIHICFSFETKLANGKIAWRTSAGSMI